MSNTKRIIIAVIAVLAVVAGAVAYSLVVANKTSAPEASQHDHNDGTHSHEGAHEAGDNAEVAATITYDGSAFQPSDVEVKAGANVKVTNDSSEALEFGSDPHPTHTDNPELNTGDIPPHESKTITLNEKGEWGFHNHYDPSQRGSITVK